MVIYITENLINGKKYIGKDSKNDPKYIGSGQLLLKDIKKYGKENFKKSIIEYCKDDEELSIRESFWIKKHNALQKDDYYNIVDFSAGWNLSKLGKEKYDYVVEKISKGKKNKKLGPQSIQTCEKKRKANKNKSKPEGFGKLISDIKKAQNKTMSQETKNKISKAKKNHPCFQTDSFKEKHSKSILQFDKEGNLLKEFKSIQEAADSNEIFKRSNISCNLSGISKYAYGYKWVYKK
jgi:group I intron endonuclease